MALETIDPTTGTRVKLHDEATGAAVEAALARSEAAFQDWRGASFAVRGGVLVAAAAQLRSRRDALALLMAVEMGKPVAQGRAEAEKCAWVCEHYAERAEAGLAPQEIATDARRSFVRFDPLGPVLAVMPWNFPLWQVFRAAAPALMAGDTLLLKHASNVTGCALEIADVFASAGAPAGVFETLLVGSARVAGLIASPVVRAVTLTGSTPAGRAVAAAAGGALKKTVLELGGSDPYLVLADADVDAAAETCATARLVNGGQSCIAAKRFVVERSVLGRFEEAFCAAMARRRVGDPRDETTEVGPQARVDLRDALHAQVAGSLARGARLLLGGVVPAGPGAFYPPTVIADAGPGMPVYDEETFGPVAAIVPVADEAEAVRVANDTPFGLAAAIFTRDTERALRLARAIDAGSVFVNAFVRSDPRLPFGGVKESGYGRELSDMGLREFVNAKTVYVA